MHLGPMSYSGHFLQQRSKRTRHTLPEKRRQQILYPACTYLFKLVQSVQRQQRRYQNDVNDFIPVFLLLHLNRFQTLSWCFRC